MMKIGSKASPDSIHGLEMMKLLCLKMSVNMCCSLDSSAAISSARSQSCTNLEAYCAEKSVV